MATEPLAKTEYPFDRLLKILEQAEIELSPIELAEILWIRLQRGDEIIPAPLSNPLLDVPTLPPPLLTHSPPPSPPRPDHSPAQDRSVNVVTQPPKPPERQDWGGSSLPVKIPDAIALRNRRAIARSLRPLLRKVPSRLRRTLDEEATAVQIAESQVSINNQQIQSQSWSPVVRSEPERWLDLAIVVEITSVYEVWLDTIAEFQKLLERHGAFREVRTWHLQADEKGNPQLYLQTASGLKAKPRKPKELHDTSGRRLILLLSDCTSNSWQSGEIPKLLKLWSKQNPVTIVQLLPLRYWYRTVIGNCHLVGLRSQKPGSLSSEWKIEGLSAWRRQKLPKGLNLNLPVVTLHPNALGNWAKAIAAQGEERTTGIVLVPKAYPIEKSDNLANQTPIQQAKQLVQDFRQSASAKAKDLADRMAVLPITWPVLRLIQKNWGQNNADTLQDTDTLYLAEIFLSRLINTPSKIQTDKKQRDKQQYDFVQNVREVLLGTIPITEAFDIAETIAEQVFKELPPDLQERINADIANRFDQALSYFEAFLIPDLDWGENAGQIRPFANVNGQILRKWGRKYAEWANELEGLLVPEQEQEPVLTSEEEWEYEYPVATLIVLETLSFEVATLTLSVEAFEFTVATLQITGKGNRSRLTIQRQTQQAWQFTEDLGQEVSLEMLAIPAGKFLMGSPPNELERSSSEDPQHEVSIESFFMGKYPITQAQWRQVASFPQINRELNPDPSQFKGDDRPVEYITWYDAVEFCERLSQKTGRSYRLPTEAEWEYACRAGTTTPFHFGETITTDLANYDGNYTYGVGKKGVYRKETTPVGSFKVANAFGLYDMHGNVWEWCEDEWHKNYVGAPTDGTAWTAKNDENSSKKVLRGGSWYYVPDACRSASRDRNEPDDDFYHVGLRVVCSASRTL